MDSRKHIIGVLLFLLANSAACNSPAVTGIAALPSTTPASASADELTSASDPNPKPDRTMRAASATSPVQPTPTATEVVFEVGDEITIPYLRGLEIGGSPITFERELTPTFYYQQHMVSYISEGNKIFGLLTIPNTEPPNSGFKAIVFNHGYIPPDTYHTTEHYTAYVDYLARNGFVVFKIDYRGHGRSEGQPTGSYFSPGYTIDAIAALMSLQTLDMVDPQGIGMWGHSMAGNLVLRAMLIEPEIQAGVIFGGAVYSYDDFAAYGIDDNTYRPRTTPDETDRPRRSQAIFDVYGRPDTATEYWQAVSLTENIGLLDRPLQLHHAQDDPVVSIRYSEDLAAVLLQNGKEYEFYIYEGGGHNFFSPYFDQAMRRTVEFFRDHL